MKHKFKIAVLCLVLIFLMMNILQGVFHLTTIQDLKGSVSVPERPRFTAKRWFSGSYANLMNEYIKGTYGFRNEYIRLNNQIGFSVFKKAYANGVVIGKDNFLYEDSYINAFYGLDYIGADSIHTQAAKLKYLQDTLHRLGCELLVVLNPGKASYYPEYIPDNIKGAPALHTNMFGYEKALGDHHVHHIDFYKWFNEQKSKTRYPLFPKYGIHWSNYAEYVVADSLATYIGALIHRDLPRVEITGIELSSDMKGRDNDIADGMNLLFPLKSFPMAYPSVVTKDSNTYRPNVLVISDSFYWGMISLGLSARYFNNNHFWYYNNECHSSRNEPVRAVRDLDIQEELKKHEVVVIMATEATINDLGWGFIDKAYREFKYGKPGRVIHNADHQKLEDWKKLILQDQQWVMDVRERAEDKGISFDSSLVLDALFQLNLHENKK